MKAEWADPKEFIAVAAAIGTDPGLIIATATDGERTRVLWTPNYPEDETVYIAELVQNGIGVLELTYGPEESEGFFERMRQEIPAMIERDLPEDLA